MRKYFGLVLASALFATTGICAEGWPKGLESAALAEVKTLQLLEDAIKESKPSDPLGLVPMSAFDRSNHYCHEVTGQAYKIVGEPNYIGPNNKGEEVVKSPYRIFYRQADLLEDLFTADWREGTGGLIQMTFKRLDDTWEMTGWREMISLTGSTGGHPGDQPMTVPEGAEVEEK